MLLALGLAGGAAAFHRVAPSLRGTPFAAELAAQAAAAGAGRQLEAQQAASGTTHAAQCALILHTDLMGNDLLSSETSKPLPQPCPSPAACCDMCSAHDPHAEPKGK